MGIEKQCLVAGPQGPFEIPRLERLAGIRELGRDFACPALLQILRPGRAGACGFAADSAAACSMASMSSRMSESHRPSLSSMAFRKASSSRSDGRSWAEGIAARSIRTGITRMRSFLSALATSTRRKSSGLSRRRRLEPGILNVQPLPPDDGQEHRARFELVLDELEEVRPGRNVVGVLEDAVGAEMAAQRGSRASTWPELSSRR